MNVFSSAGSGGGISLNSWNLKDIIQKGEYAVDGSSRNAKTEMAANIASESQTAKEQNNKRKVSIFECVCQLF